MNDEKHYGIIGVILLIAIVVAVATSVFLYMNEMQEQSHVKEVTPSEFSDMIDNVSCWCSFHIIDVRTPEEYIDFHISNGSTNVPWGDSFRSDMEYFFDEYGDDTFVVYCNKGIKSLEAAQVMYDIGYRDLYSLEGGIERWIQEGYLSYVVIGG